MKKLPLFALLLVVALTGAYSYLHTPAEPNGAAISGVITDDGKIEVYFCPQDDCEQALVSFLDSAGQSIHCALYDIGLKSVQQTLLEKSKTMEVKVVTDDEYLKKFNYPFVKADSYGLMHNKFCIIDGIKVSTGSMNPTDNDAHKNNNNLLLIASSVMAQNYEDEFSELWDGRFKGGEKVRHPELVLSNIPVRNYFCPDDSCAYHVKEELKKAQESIHFMTFSFTNEGIANILLLKNVDGVSVRGVMETTQVSKYSQFERLKNNGIDVVKDQNKKNMHHKVFIIDSKTVVTGSFNPTANGDQRNDENIIIIEDETIARLFLEEFERVYGEAEENNKK